MKLIYLSALLPALSGNGANAGQVRYTSGGTVVNAKVTLKDRDTWVSKTSLTGAVANHPRQMQMRLSMVF